MKSKLHIFITAIVLFFIFSATAKGQTNKPQQPTKQTLPEDKMHSSENGYRVSTYVYHGDTIPNILFQQVVIYPPMQFTSDAERMEFIKLVYNVKKVLPIAIQICNLIVETTEYMETLPNDKAKLNYIKRVEKGIKEQYTAQMKKLTFKQGKLLIKLVDRQSNNQTAYDLIKAFMGPFKAIQYQVFAALYGASLRKQYDPTGEDKLTERVVCMVIQGEI